MHRVQMPAFLLKEMQKNKGILRAINNVDNKANRQLRATLANDASRSAKVMKFLSKNRKWGIPATLAGGALGALGIHNMID